MELHDSEYECFHCMKIFDKKAFDVSRAYERVHYRGPDALDEVEVEDAFGIAVYCCRTCLDAELRPLMQE